jgi:hypothetical protein
MLYFKNKKIKLAPPPAVNIVRPEINNNKLLNESLKTTLKCIKYVYVAVS